LYLFDHAVNRLTVFCYNEIAGVNSALDAAHRN
jgi:hypothetical protein